jgi:hypothetical protein
LCRLDEESGIDAGGDAERALLCNSASTLDDIRTTQNLLLASSPSCGASRQRSKVVGIALVELRTRQLVVAELPTLRDHYHPAPNGGFETCHSRSGKNTLSVLPQKGEVKAVKLRYLITEHVCTAPFNFHLHRLSRNLTMLKKCRKTQAAGLLSVCCAGTTPLQVNSFAQFGL